MLQYAVLGYMGYQIYQLYNQPDAPQPDDDGNVMMQLSTIQVPQPLVPPADTSLKGLPAGETSLKTAMDAGSGAPPPASPPMDAPPAGLPVDSPPPTPPPAADAPPPDMPPPTPPSDPLPTN